MVVHVICCCGTGVGLTWQEGGGRTHVALVHASLTFFSGWNPGMSVHGDGSSLRKQVAMYKTSWLRLGTGALLFPLYPIDQGQRPSLESDWEIIANALGKGEDTTGVKNWAVGTSATVPHFINAETQAKRGSDFLRVYTSSIKHVTCLSNAFLNSPQGNSGLAVVPLQCLVAVSPCINSLKNKFN